jgi:hypothetical protein
LTHNVIGLTFGGLNVFDGSILVDIAFVIDIQLAESILKCEDLALRELRILASRGISRRRKAGRR